jgi:L-ascorbate metabolism protein UlaG (beta-lactamase superfamily)
MRADIHVIRFLRAFGFAVLALAQLTDSRAQDSPTKAVTIEFIAHACFRVTSPAGKHILIDPYASRVWLGYDFPPGIQADAVLISHPHYDHDYGERGGRKLPWLPPVVIARAPGTHQIGDITVQGIAGKHADPWGKEFGQINTIWLLQAGGLRIVHLGDNGPLTRANLQELGRVDVLMLPIDSQFHILKADQIADIRSKLSPRVLIPMHYRHDDLELDPKKPELLGGIDDWARGQINAHYLSSNLLELSSNTLPNEPEIIVFKHSPLVRVPSKPAEPKP